MYKRQRKAAAKVAAASPLVTLMPDQVESTHSLVRYGVSGLVCVVCRKTANSVAAAHKLAWSLCCPIFPVASGVQHVAAVMEDTDNDAECVFCLSELI